MKRPSLRFLDARFVGRSVFAAIFSRLMHLLPVAFLLVAVVSSGGADRFLSGRIVLTAVMKQGVGDAEGRGLAEKVARLPMVRSATYTSPDSAWNDFVAIFPGMDPLKASTGNPLPGYIEIRLRQGRMSRSEVDQLAAAVAPLSQVDRFLTGGESLLRLLAVRERVNWILYGVLAAMAFQFAVVVRLQERVIFLKMRRRVEFLVERGESSLRIARGRALDSALVTLCTASIALCAAFGLHLLLWNMVPSLHQVVGPVGPVLREGDPYPFVGFVIFAAVAAALASFAGGGVRTGSGRR